MKSLFRNQKAFTLTEVVISVAIAGISVGSVITGYILTSKRAEWSSYSLAAHSLAIQGLEQARACKWDLSSSPEVDELVPGNFPMRTNVLDVPITGTNYVWATNFTTVTTVSANPPLKMIQVDCVWAFSKGGTLYTNTIVTYRSPDA